MNGPLERRGRGALQLPGECNKLLLQLAEVPRGIFRVSGVLHSSYGTVSYPKHGVMCTTDLRIAFPGKRKHQLHKHANSGNANGNVCELLLMCCLTPWKGGFLGAVSCSGLQPKLLTELQDVRDPESRLLKSLVGCDILSVDLLLAF